MSAPLKDSEKADFYVYALVDPRNGEAFYIGKGRGQRCRTHVLDAKAGREQWNYRKAAVIRDILQSGRDVDVRKLVSGLTESEALARERQMIMAQRASLTNIAPGVLTDAEKGYWFLLDHVKRMRKPTQWAAHLRKSRGYGPSWREMKLYGEVAVELVAELRKAVADMQEINIAVPISVDAALSAWQPTHTASTPG